jgi:hypothetical protein
MRLAWASVVSSDTLERQMQPRTIVHRSDTWPVVVSAIFGKEHSEQALNEAYAQWTEFLRRGQHVLIMDMTRGTAGATAAQRARVAAWIEQNQALLKQHQLAHIMVMDSPIIRGIVTAVAWLRPSASPQLATSTLDEAVDRAVSYLRQAGISVAPELVARARQSISTSEPTTSASV